MRFLDAKPAVKVKKRRPDNLARAAILAGFWAFLAASEYCG
jgi:hypothetical protein